MVYNIVKDRFNTVIWYEQNNVRISFIADQANTDYQQFKKDIMAGGELKDADGVVMANAKEFVGNLP